MLDRVRRVLIEQRLEPWKAGRDGKVAGLRASRKAHGIRSSARLRQMSC
jgi:hypothetical protein